MRFCVCKYRCLVGAQLESSEAAKTTVEAQLQDTGSEIQAARAALTRARRQLCEQAGLTDDMEDCKEAQMQHHTEEEETHCTTEQLVELLATACARVQTELINTRELLVSTKSELSAKLAELEADKAHQAEDLQARREAREGGGAGRGRAVDADAATAVVAAPSGESGDGGGGQEDMIRERDTRAELRTQLDQARCVWLSDKDDSLRRRW